MKRIIAVLLSLLTIMLCFCSCGKNERILFNDGLDKYITLGEYKGIKVDTTTDEFKAYTENEISKDIDENQFYTEKEDGIIANGNIANINYVGKKDGVAFEGGTAEKYDLLIGSGTFIEGFEEGLVGAKTGETIDLNLTFPENYNNTELAGKAVVFTVTVNSVKRTQTPEEYYKELDFASLKKYNADVKMRAVKNVLIDEVVNGSKVKDYPKEDMDILLNSMVGYYESLSQAQYGVDFSTILASDNMTLDTFKEQMKESSIKPLMKVQMPIYQILIKEKLEFTVEESENEDEYYKALAESAAVEDAVKDFLYKNAKIK